MICHDSSQRKLRVMIMITKVAICDDYDKKVAMGDDYDNKGCHG